MSAPAPSTPASASSVSSPASAPRPRCITRARRSCRAEVARWVTDAGLSIDVCSGGELAVALAAGIAPERLGFHGNNKSVAEIDRAVQVGIGVIVLDSLIEIERVAAAAEHHGLVQPVRLRVNTGVHAHTHEYLATAREDQKFGIALDGCRGRRRRDPRPPHAGVPRTARPHRLPDFRGGRIRRVGVEAARVARRAAGGRSHPRTQPRRRIRHRLHAGRSRDAAGGYCQALADIVQSQCARLQIPVPVVAVEPGRSIVGPSTVTLYEVGTVKDVEVSSRGDAGSTCHQRHPQVRQRRRRHERQRPPGPLRRRLQRADRQPHLGRGSRPRARRRKALRKRRHRRARRLPARGRGTGRPARRPGDRRILLVHGEQLQLSGPPRRGGGAGRRRPRHCARRNRGRPALP